MMKKCFPNNFLMGEIIGREKMYLERSVLTKLTHFCVTLKEPNAVGTHTHTHTGTPVSCSYQPRCPDNKLSAAALRAATRIQESFAQPLHIK